MKHRSWLSITNIAEKLGITKPTVFCMIEHKLLPQPKLLAVDNRGLHWNKDDLELFIFKNARHSVEEETTNNATLS